MHGQANTGRRILNRHIGSRLVRTPFSLAWILAGSLLLGSCGGEDSGVKQPAESGVTLPLQQTADLREAAGAAGCELTNPPIAGSQHADRAFTAADYKTNPPTSGTHHPTWAQDGIYDADATPNLGMLVHTLEHGRVNYQYRPDVPEKTVAQLEAIVAENEGYHTLLYENTTDMPFAVAATAWGRSLGCRELSDEAIDALRVFRTRFIDKGPEAVP